MNELSHAGPTLAAIFPWGRPIQEPVLTKKEFFIYNLLVRVYLIIATIIVDRPCAMNVWIPFSK